MTGCHLHVKHMSCGTVRVFLGNRCRPPPPIRSGLTPPSPPPPPSPSVVFTSHHLCPPETVGVSEQRTSNSPELDDTLHGRGRRADGRRQLDARCFLQARSRPLPSDATAQTNAAENKPPEHPADGFTSFTSAALRGELSAWRPNVNGAENQGGLVP